MWNIFSTSALSHDRLCRCGLSAKSSITIKIWKRDRIFSCLLVSVILRCWRIIWAQRRLVPLLEVGLLPVHRHLHGLLDVLLDGAPAVVYVDAGAEYVDSFEAAPVLLQNHADQRYGLARLAGPKQYTSHWQFRDHWVLRVLARILGRRKQLYPAHGRSRRARNSWQHILSVKRGDRVVTA